MWQKTTYLKYFLFSQYLADGVRITLEILLPAFIGSQFGRLEVGILVSTGALCVSMSDAPGPLEHKLNGMLYCNILVFLMALLTGIASQLYFLPGLLILLASFFFSMFTVFGLRASSVGLAALLIIILRMDRVIPVKETITESFLILAGGLWYMMLALIFYKLRPFRQAQRSLGNCIHETSKLLLIKASMYDPSTNIIIQYKAMIDQQVIVSESQDEVRQLLYKGKEIIKDSSRAGKALLITFTDVIDLYEQATATLYNYDLLRAKFSSARILPEISSVTVSFANELDKIGLAIQSDIPYKKEYEFTPALIELKRKMDAVKLHGTNNIVLIKILINLRNLGEHISAVSNYFVAEPPGKRSDINRIDYSKFVSHQEISVAVFRDNLVLSSSVFRHALRIMITCVAGFIIGKLLPYGHHSYWILLTIVFIMKPGYSITRQRNIQRIAGTIAGGVIGVALIATIHNRSVLFALVVFFMIGTYTWQRLNYIITVLFMTPYILILFSFLGLGFIGVVEERVLDTAIASVLAFVASYFLFPHWESKQLDNYMTGLLKANIGYLQWLKTFFSGKQGSLQEYKLTRKEMYVSTANLSAAFNRMLSEPKKKQHYSAEINEFVVLNNILSSNMVSLYTINPGNEQPAVTKDILLPLQRAVTVMQDSLLLMDKNSQPAAGETYVPLPDRKNGLADPQLKEQVDFILKVSNDIRKVVQKVTV